MQLRFLLPIVASLTSTPIWADIKVVTDIAPVAGIVSAIGQNMVTATVLIDPDQSAHHVTLRPSQAAAVAGGDLVVMIGDTLTPGLYERMQSIAPAKIISMDLLNGVERHSQNDGHGEHDHDDHGHETGLDPHLWLSPENGALLATAIRDQFMALDPEHADTFRQNHSVFLAKLNDIVASAPKPLDQVTIAVSHDAFAYFQETLGDIETIVLTDALGSAPSPRAVADAHHALQNTDVACFIIDPQSPTALGEALAYDYGIPIVTLSPMAAAQTTSQNAYLDLMQTMVDGFSTCLNPIK